MPERILVCDDDPQIRRALALILREAGYEVLLTASAEEALDRAAVAGAQLAIVDLLLPDGHGIELYGEPDVASEGGVDLGRHADEPRFVAVHHRLCRRRQRYAHDPDDRRA